MGDVMRLLISAGGTGGHIYPALAIIKKFQEKNPNLEVLYIGTHNRMENTIIPEHNIPYQSLKIYGFTKNIWHDFQNIGLLCKSFNKCLKIMKEFKPDIVIGAGGYVTMPVIMAANRLKIKCVIHEQNSIPGKTNKFLSGGVDIVFTSFKESQNYFKKNVNCIYSGNPAADNVNLLKPISKSSLGLTKNKKLVLITSGSLGSSAMNNKLLEFLKLSEKEDYEIVFLIGKRNYEEFIGNNHFSKNIKIISYLDNLAAFFKNCDLIISRAGAGTIAEICAAKTPAILIPSTNVANNHQYYNAKSLADNKEALMIEEKDLEGAELYKLVKELLNNSNLFQTIKENLNKRVQTFSSEIIYQEILKVIKNAK